MLPNKAKRMPTKKIWKTRRDLVLYVQSATSEAVEAIRKYYGPGKIRIGVIVHNKHKNDFEALRKKFDIVIAVNFNSPRSIIQGLHPYEEETLAITCRSESNMNSFRQLIPYFPFQRTPTSESIEWATDKIKMRRRFAAYDPSITPKFMVVKDESEATITEIKKKIGFPLVVKPAGLAQSLLVTLCFHEEDLQKALRKNFRLIKTHYKGRRNTDEARILVEEFMEGNMYSIDSYVNSRGQVYHCPPVYVETGRTIGFDDFFNYYQVTPTQLSKESIKKLEEVAEKGVHALGLRNTTAHIELLRTEKGWKLIEIGARIGGFRQKFYEMAFGIDHTMNDIRIRIPEKPIIPKKARGYAGILKFYSRKEGRLASIKGVKKIQNLPSVSKIEVNRKAGDMCRFAKHGGKSVINVILFHASRQQFLADKRRIEQAIQVITS